MDPFSITVGCLAILKAASEASSGLAILILTLRDAKSDLRQASQQLKQLELVVRLIRENFDPEPEISEAQREVIYSNINDCLDALQSIASIIKDHYGPWGSSRWAMTGNGKFGKANKTLEKSIERLSLVLQGYQSSIMRGLKVRSDQLVDGCDEIQKDLTGILNDTTTLKLLSSKQTCSLDKVQEELSDMNSKLQVLFQCNQSPGEGKSSSGEGVMMNLNVPRAVAGTGNWMSQGIRCFSPKSADRHELRDKDEFTDSAGTEEVTFTGPLPWCLEKESLWSDRSSWPQPEFFDPLIASTTAKPFEYRTPTDNASVVKFKNDVLAKANAAKLSAIHSIRSESGETRRVVSVLEAQYCSNALHREIPKLHSDSSKFPIGIPRLDAKQKAVADDFRKKVWDIAKSKVSW